MVLVMKDIGITIYGSEQDEADVFQEISSRFGVTPTIVSSPISETNVMLAPKNKCISVGHKSEIHKSILIALKESGVKYISTRSIGYNHIDMKAAEKMGIAVENVTYSPDSVADYTLMLILVLLQSFK